MRVEAGRVFIEGLSKQRVFNERIIKIELRQQELERKLDKIINNGR
jgi:hypothetical protein